MGAAAAAAGLAVALAATLAGGCASPGNPRAPSLHLEEVAAAPETARLGDQVVVRWTTPGATTDGGRVSLPLTAVLCREVVTPAQTPARTPAQTPCVPVLQVAATPGAAGEVTDTLPKAMLGARSLLAYRIEILNGRGRSAGLSEPGFAAGGPAPAPAGPLTLTGRPGGTLIRWAGPGPAGSVGVMEVTRTAAVAQAAAGKRGGAGSGAGAGLAPGLAPDPAAPVELRAGDSELRAGNNELRPGAAGSGRPDGLNGLDGLDGLDGLNGLIDTSVLDPRADGLAFRYVAQRVERVKIGQHLLELRGLASPPSTFTYTHTFAPDAPVGLVAIPAVAPAAIDLSWESSTAADLLGYNVYRRTGTGEFSRVTAKPVTIPSFRDFDVMRGRTYTYRVTALDRHHNESAPSGEAQESVNP